jgi:NitT/TauT family transport system substrate-binding protein
VRNKYIKPVLILAIITVMLAACGGDDGDEEAQSSSPASDATSIQLAWVHTMEYAGLYVAQDQGFFAEENLDVELQEGGFDADGNFIFSIEKVTSGEADFGVIGADQLLIARSEGAPLVAIAALYQRSPVVLMSLAENNIQTPADLIGKSIAIDLQTATGLSFVAMLSEQNIALDDINIVDRTDFTNTLLTDGDVDVLDGFITNQPIALAQEGHDLNLILPSDYGVDLYTNVIFTTEDMIANQPELVARFLRAVLRGYEVAVDDPETGADLAIARNDSLLPENELAGMLASVPLLAPAGSNIGAMSAEVWQTTYDLLLAQDILTSPFDVTTAYDLSLVNAIYGE